MAVWPLILPQKPLRDGYARTLPNMLLRTGMDTGPDKVRYRGGHKPQVADVTYVLTDGERDALEIFLSDTVKGGALCFDWPHPETGKYVLARVVADSGGLCGIRPYHTTLYWQVTLKIEFWPDAPTGG